MRLLDAASACWRVWGHGRPWAGDDPLVPPVLGVLHGARCSRVSCDYHHSLCPIRCCASVSPSLTSPLLAGTQGHWCGAEGENAHVDAQKFLLALLEAVPGQGRDRHPPLPK